MVKQWPIFHQLRLTLEALTPHGVQTGMGDLTHDTLLVRDANGLPALPATSIAGVLRRLYNERATNPAETNELFGYADGNAGQPSRVRFTWALAHDSSNTPIDGIADLPDGDPVIALLQEEKPLVRQRVRLSEKGVAEDKGKFDTTLVPAGCRYTCFITCWSDGSPEQENQWQRLMSCLQSDDFRLGHGTRSGQGAFRICDAAHGRWDLTNSTDAQAYQNRPRRRRDIGNLTALDLATPAEENSLPIFTLPLVAEAGWRIGGGELTLKADENDAHKAPDMLPQSEPSITWNGSKGTVAQRTVVVPASAIKGALAHRIAFHDRCLRGQWVEQTPQGESPTSDAVVELFGSASDASKDSQAGCVIIDDLYPENPKVARQMHNRIDRFTGGVMRGALFEEELLWKTPLDLRLAIKPRGDISDTSRQALKLTLEDLARGWLPLGAGGSRGNGIFTAREDGNWNDSGHWIKTGETA